MKHFPVFSVRLRRAVFLLVTALALSCGEGANGGGGAGDIVARYLDEVLRMEEKRCGVVFACGMKPEDVYEGTAPGDLGECKARAQQVVKGEENILRRYAEFKDAANTGERCMKDLSAIAPQLRGCADSVAAVPDEQMCSFVLFSIRSEHWDENSSRGMTYQERFPECEKAGDTMKNMVGAGSPCVHTGAPAFLVVGR